MDWLSTRRRVPDWKQQGWSGQTLASISTQPPPLLTILGIVLLLLSISNYSGFKAQMHMTAFNLQLFIFLLPILLILLMATLPTDGNYSFQLPQLPHRSLHQAGGIPWGVAVLLVVLLVLVSYQSSFHSKWFAGSSKY